MVRTAARFTIHGLVVSSPVPLPGGRAARDAPVDVELVCSRGAVPAPVGPVLSHVDDPVSGRRYTLAGACGGWTLTFHDTAVVNVVRDSARVEVIVAEDVDEVLLPVLLGGPTLVALALLRGHALLHASAVLTAAGVVGFVGPPGVGKSTLARLLAGAERPLISDDALRVDVQVEGVLAHRGTTSSRLRARADELSRVGSLAEHLRSGDGRQVLIDDVAAPAVAPLVAMVVPRLSPAFTRLAAEVLPRVPALVHLASACALDGLQDAELVRRQFDLAADLVARVPVLQVDVPWPSGPVDQTLGEQLAALLDTSIKAHRG